MVNLQILGATLPNFWLLKFILTSLNIFLKNTDLTSWLFLRTNKMDGGFHTHKTVQQYDKQVQVTSVHTCTHQ